MTTLDRDAADTADEASATESAASAGDTASEQPEQSQPQQAASQLLVSRPREFAPGVHGVRVLMVNVYFVKTASGFTLVDAGLPMSAAHIIDAAEQLFGPGARPDAILLTHGHFDHVGSLDVLVQQWKDVPIYAHHLEMPYLTGLAKYAPPDPWVGGGMSLSSVLYPRGPIDLKEQVRELPSDGSVPTLDGWRWIWTPGHSPGHVSFFRDSDRTLIAGDAFVTTKQESMLAVATQYQAVFGPPKYFTHDWAAAGESVRKLANLDPAVAATDHGTPMSGEALTRQLDDLAGHFSEKAVPHGGRYEQMPVIYDQTGPTTVPPAKGPPMRYIAGALIAGAVVAVACSALRSPSHSKPKNDHRWW